MRHVVRRNLKVVLPLGLAQATGYFLLNHFHLREPARLPMTALDASVPFLVESVWLYAALLSSDVLLPLCIRDVRLFHDAARAFMVSMAIHFSVWLFFPTTFPRPPLPRGDSPSALLYRTLVALDEPTNCFPSSHIAIPAISLWALSRERPRRAPLLWAGFALLAPSVLTTKQHYVADIVAGLGVAAISAIVSLALRRLA